LTCGVAVYLAVAVVAAVVTIDWVGAFVRDVPSGVAVCRCPQDVTTSMVRMAATEMIAAAATGSRQRR
jgi:hypothetical protein